LTFVFLEKRKNLRTVIIINQNWLFDKFENRLVSGYIPKLITNPHSKNRPTLGTCCNFSVPQGKEDVAHKMLGSKWRRTLPVNP
jgi:hypothetical protein